MLEPEHRLRVEQVRLALAAPLVLPADPQLAVGGVDALARVGDGVTGGDLLGDHLEVDAAELGRRAREVAVDELLRQADRLEHLGAVVRRHGGDAHLRHHLEDALAQGLDEVGDRLLRVDPGDGAGADEVLDGLHRQVGVDRGGAEADEQRDVVDLADVAGLHEETDPGAGLLADQVVVHRGGEQQRRDRGEVATGVTVGEHDEPGAPADRLGHLDEDLLEPRMHRLRAAVDLVETADDVRRIPRQVAVGVDVDDLGQLVVVDDRERQDQLARVRRGDRQGVALGADGHAERGDELLADGVERRVRDLREQLGEVVEQQPGPAGEHGDRGCRCPSSRAPRRRSWPSG